ncbi:MAG: hypothetical protein AABW50_03535 [Nanoarchaeota archaeon]
MDNKRGQGLSTSTIILLVLGLIILVVLIYGFYTGWKFLKDSTPDNNVDQVAQACQQACITKSTYDFCSRQRQITVGDQTPILGTCDGFSDSTSSVYKAEYNIVTCSDITCLG